MTADASLESLRDPKSRFCVDGTAYPNDPDGPLFMGDGEYPPFVIFDTQEQQNLPFEFDTRAAAVLALTALGVA